METAARLVNRPSPPLPAAAVKVAETVVIHSSPVRVQCQSLRVSAPGDAAEVEARHVSRRIVSMPTTAAARPASVLSPPKPSANGGEPLPEAVRQDMESRFGADFSAVRIHRDARAAQASSAINAAAFTVGNQIHFGAGQFNPARSEGRELLAHELTHTIQQGATAQAQRQIQRSTVPLVVESSAPSVQRLGLGDALNYFAEHANIIPGFRMLTLLLGFNPINMRPTDRSAANLLRALIELIPGGAFITQALDNHGVINKAAVWIEQKLATLGDIGGEIVNGLKRFVDSLSWSDIFDLGGVWERAKSIFTAPIARLISFGGSVVVEILKMVKDAILKPLAGLAQGTRGYDLLKAILGKDPITDEPYPPTAENLLGGFMKLIGQEEIWENIKKGNAIARAWAWFQGALNGLMGFVRSIPVKIIQTITSLTFQDIVTIAGAFTKIVSAFVNIAVDFVSWGLNQVISLLEIIFSVVQPTVMPYIKKAQASFVTIIKNPIGFVGNLVRAGKLGFEMFAGNIITHLKTALIKWLVGPLAEAGVYIPQSFQLMEIIKLVLSVLGLTWQNIRAKLVKIIPDPVLSGLEKTASILVTLVKDGPAAAWEQIKAELTELKDQLIGQVTEMINTEVVKAAVTKLVSMLNPAGAVIQAIIAVWNTVSFFIEKAQQIGAVVASFIDSISAIAVGQVASAAKRVEQTLANTLVVVIGFLAKFAGLGNIPTKLVGIVKKVRKPIDKGLDKIVAWLGGLLKKLVGGVKNLAGSVLQWWKAKKQFTDKDGESHSVYFQGENENAELMVASTPKLAHSVLNEIAKNDDTAKAVVASIKAKMDQVRDRKLKITSFSDAAENKKNMDAIQKLIDKIGGLFATISIAGKSKTMKQVPLSFERIFTGMDSEYARQLGEQQSALTNMTIAKWLTNRYVFEKKGRINDGTLRQQINNKNIEYAKYKAEQIKKGITDQKEIKRLWQYRVAATHSLDQVAGGDHYVFSNVGVYSVNSHLGTQWKTKVETLTTAVKAVNPAVYGTEKMKVILK